MNPEDLSRLPMPPPDERFVRRVMSRILEESQGGSFWRGFWKIPALGLAFATVLFAILTAFQAQTSPRGVFETVLMTDEAGEREAVLELALNVEENL